MAVSPPPGAAEHRGAGPDGDRDPLLPVAGDLRQQALQQQIGHLVARLHPLRDDDVEARLRGRQHEGPGPEDPQGVRVSFLALRCLAGACWLFLT